MYGERSSTTAKSTGWLSRTTSSRSAGSHAYTATARVPFWAMSLAISVSRTRSMSAFSATRSSWSSPSAWSTRWAASVITEVTAVERAAGVANSVGSRLRKTDRTRPRSGLTSASRRRRVRVIVLAAMSVAYPPCVAGERCGVTTRTVVPDR